MSIWLAQSLVDKEPTSLDLAGAQGALFRELLAAAEARLPSIINKVNASADDPDAFDDAYRTVHYFASFCRVLELTKIARVLFAGETALDILREKGALQKGSLEYVVKLSISIALEMLRELEDAGVSHKDVSEIIGECARYIEPMLELASQAEQADGEQSSDNRFESAESANSIEERSLEPPGGSKPIVEVKEAEASTYVEFDEQIVFSSEQLALADDFCAEAHENLSKASARLIELEQTGGDREILNDLFRAIHTVKGGARLLSIKKIETLSHEMESLLGDLRNGDRSVDESTIDILMESNKALSEMVDEIAARKAILTPIDYLLRAMRALRAGAQIAVRKTLQASAGGPAAPAITASSGRAHAAADETLRVPTSKLDDVLNTASEVFVTRIRLQSDVAALSNAVAELQNIVQSARLAPTSSQTGYLQQSRHEDKNLLQLTDTLNMGARAPGQSLEAFAHKPELEQKLVEESPFSEELKLRIAKIDLLRKQLQKGVSAFEGLSNRLQSSAMNFRMVPISQLFNRFPPLVRDMARNVGKRVRLEIEGNATELDKVLIGQLIDPMIHIMRNALDHGIEEPHERVAAGKPEVGSIHLTAYYEGSYVVIEVIDDGRGIDKDRVLTKAISTGLVAAERASQMTSAEILALIFEPGFSTARSVSELSGRGVGMDVVRNAVQQMQGSLSVESDPGKGARIRLKMPLTLAVVGIVLVEENGFQFAIPVLNVVEVLLVPREEVRFPGGAMAMNFRGKTLPLYALSNIMGFTSSPFFEDDLSVVVLTDGEREIGIVVEKLLGRHDVLIKQFGRLVRKLPFLIGCTILSDNRLVSVLNINEIVRHSSGVIRNEAIVEPSGESRARRDHTILIVDDSTIQRNRVASALVRGGYRVVTAEDGFEAIGLLNQRHFSACCIDVFMPIIDGIELVERLRGSAATEKLPVFMMSGRAIEQRHDQQRVDRLGVIGFFQKPFNSEDLIAHLDAVLLDPRVAQGSIAQ